MKDHIRRYEMVVEAVFSEARDICSHSYRYKFNDSYQSPDELAAVITLFHRTILRVVALIVEAAQRIKLPECLNRRQTEAHSFTLT